MRKSSNKVLFLINKFLQSYLFNFGNVGTYLEELVSTSL